MIDTPMVANEGLLIAHDLLEHQQGLSKIGSLGDELIALGGVWYVRGQWGDMRRDRSGSMYTPEQSIASDVYNMFEIYARGVPLRVKVPSNKAGDHEDAINTIISIARQSIVREYADNTGETLDYKKLHEYLDQAQRLLRVGIRMARKRYNGEALMANSMFWRIAEAVDKVAKWCDYEGQRFELKYDYNRATCNEVFEEVY